MRDIAIDLRKTCIVGAGGLGKCALHVAFSTRAFPIVMLDDNVKSMWVVGALHMLDDKTFFEAHKFVVAIGDNAIRNRICGEIVSRGGALDKLTHPSAVVKPLQVGEGSIVLPGVVVGPDAIIGDRAILGNAVSVAHDCVVGSCVNICDGTVLGGHAEVKDGVFIGLNATVLPKVRIGYGAIVGAGSVVTEDIPDGETWVGVPARPK